MIHQNISSTLNFKFPDLHLIPEG